MPSSLAPSGCETFACTAAPQEALYGERSFAFYDGAVLGLSVVVCFVTRAEERHMGRNIGDIVCDWCVQKKFKKRNVAQT